MPKKPVKSSKKPPPPVAVVPVAPRPPGRPRTLDATKRTVILTASRCGLPRADAARVAGIGWSTYKLWLTKAKAGDREYQEFFEEIERAESEGKLLLLKRIRDAGQGQWQPNAWLLERRWPEEFGQSRTVKVQVEREVESLFDCLRDGLTAEAFAEVVRVAARFVGEEAAAELATNTFEVEALPEGEGSRT